MSNPLAYFRRHQKVLLAVFGVLIIIIFTVGGIFTDYQQRQMGYGPASDTVVTWKHGTIGEDDLANMRATHGYAVQFLRLLCQRTIEAEGTPKGPGVTRDQRGQIMDPGIPGSYQEEDLVRTALLARKAEDTGVVVTEEAIYEFLDELSDDVIPRSQFASILRDATGGRFIKQQLFEQLRIELLAQNMRMMAASGLMAMPPGDAWDYFNRSNRRIKAEVLPLAVSDFKAKVKGDPSDAEVEELYAQAKDRYPNPDSPEPGFKRRKKIAFQYLRTEFQKFMDKEMAAVTKEQVEEYYEKNKDDFKAPELPPVEDEKGEETGGETEPESGSAKSSEASAETSPETTEPEKESSGDAAEPNPPKADREPGPAEDDPVEASDASDTNGASNLRSGDIVFVSLLADQDSGDGEAEPRAESVSGDLADDAGAEKKKEPKPEEAPAADDDEPSKDTAEEQDAAPQKEVEADAKEAKKEKPVKYKPLEEVEEEIRRTIARPIAQKKMDEALEDARREIDVYFRKRMKWQGLKEAKLEGEEPTPLDPDALAEKFGFTAGETPLVDEIGIGDFELGKAYRFSFNQRQVQTITFAQIAYAEGIPLYKADQIRSFEVDVEFLYWKVEEQEPYVPELADIRQEVVDAWKQGEALQVAKVEAEKLAKKIKGTEPMMESLDKDLAEKVVETNEFSWMTEGAVPMGFGQPTLSSVDGVEFAGMDFMESVFSLDPGETGVAVNQPQTIVYVVRVASESPDEEELRQKFLQGGFYRAVSLAGMERYRFMGEWYRDLDKEMEVEWHRPAQLIRSY
jgi:hypothetical protein